MKWKTKCIVTAIVSLCLISLSGCSTVNDQLSQTTANGLTSDQTSIWQALSHQFKFQKDHTQPLVQQEIRFIKANPRYLQTLTRNAQPFIQYVSSQVSARHMPAEIACLPMIESSYNPFLVSKSGATGIWQMMPGTATGWGLSINWWYDSRRDIVASTTAALDYLDYLHRYFNNWQLAIAAYNAGEGTVENAILFNQRHHKPTDFWHLSLPAETKMYLPKLLAVTALLQPNGPMKKSLFFVSTTPYVTTFQLQHQFSLPILANLTDTSEQQIRQLNPGFRRFSTGPKNRKLLIPINKLETFEHNLSTYTGNSITWRHHIVTSGDNLYTLAKEYHTKPSIIKSVNHLQDDTLKINQILLIPQSRILPTNQQSLTSDVIAEDNIPGPRHIIYTVRQHDNINAIAEKFNISKNQIVFWNQLNSSKIKPGDKLDLWKKPIIFKPNYFIHTVRKGESLNSIASQFNVTVKILKSTNHINKPVIKINQKLHIPYPKKQHFVPQFQNQMVIHHVGPGDSISSLADYYQVSKQQIIKLNHLDKNQYLHLGQPIKIIFSQK